MAVPIPIKVIFDWGPRLDGKPRISTKGDRNELGIYYCWGKDAGESWFINNTFCDFDIYAWERESYDYLKYECFPATGHPGIYRDYLPQEIYESWLKGWYKGIEVGEKRIQAWQDSLSFRIESEMLKAMGFPDGVADNSNSTCNLTFEVLKESICELYNN